MRENEHSHRRLMIAMGLSSILIASLLGIMPLPLGDPECSDTWCFGEPNKFIVFLKQQTIESISEISLPDYETQTARQASKATGNPRPTDARRKENAAAQADIPGTPSDQTPVRDWYALAREPVSQSIEDYFGNEEIRKQMWRRTGSVMFKDKGEFDFHEPATIISAREFKIPVGVLGIGLTIGGCFFGIPLAGIPVEERGAGPNVIYCTDIYETTE